MNKGLDTIIRYYKHVLNDTTNILFDVSHRRWFSGVKKLGFTSVQSSDVRTIAALFRKLGNRCLERMPSGTPIVDIGCGRGRVIQWLLANGYQNPIVGVEIDEETAKGARRRFSGECQVEIITGDIVDALRPEWLFFYACNPFGSEIGARRFYTLLKKLHEAHEHELVVLFLLNYRSFSFRPEGPDDYLSRWMPRWSVSYIKSLGSWGRWDSVGLFVLNGDEHG